MKLSADGKTIEQARISVGAVAPTPKFAAEASAWLAGKPATDESFAQAGELAKKIATPITDMRGPAEYRTHLVGVLVKRTLATAAERARQQLMAEQTMRRITAMLFLLASGAGVCAERRQRPKSRRMSSWSPRT